MKAFTYYDYIQCIHSIRLNKGQGLAEGQAEYQIGEKKKRKLKNENSKLVKTIFNNKEEMAKLINGFLNPNRKINSKDLIRYTNSNFAKRYKSEKDNIFYKIKNEEIYFFVEHQSSIDNKIPEKILNYSIDIIQEWSRTRKSEKRNNYPIIIPIIIYTGKEKWKIDNNLKNIQQDYYDFENSQINIEYNLIEVNKISKQKLLNQNSFFGYCMVLEKSKGEKEIEQNLNLIFKSDKNNEYIEKLQNIIMYFIFNMSEETKERILKRFEKNMERKQNHT